MLQFIIFISFLPHLIYSQQSTWIHNQRRQSIQKSYNQPCTFKIVEKCFKKFDRYSHEKYSVGVLSTNNGLDDLCNITRSTFNCLINGVNHCGPPFQRELIKNIIKEFTRTVDKFCEPGKLREDFTKFAPCIVDQVINTNDYKENCYYPFLTSIGGTFSVKTMDSRLEVACCAYNKWQNCLYQKVTDECKEDGKEAMIFFIEKLFGEAPNRVCPINEFDAEGTKCNNMLEKNGLQSLESTIIPAIRFLSSQLMKIVN